MLRWVVMYMDVRYAGFAGAKTCPWPVPRFIPGASHGKTVHPPQSPVGFTVLFELLIPVLLQEKPEKYMVIVSVAVFDKA